MKILGLDPGVHTGYALLEFQQKKPKLITIGESLDPTLAEIRHLLVDSDLVVVEDWMTRPGKARQGAFDFDPMVTPRVIGACQALCTELGKKMVLQQPSIKPVGYGFAGRKYQKGKKNMHSIDALAHVMYYAVRHSVGNPLDKIAG